MSHDMSRSIPFRHPLKELIPAQPGIRAVDHLEISSRQAIMTLLSMPGREADVAAAMAAAEDIALRYVSPGEWLALSRIATPDDLARDLSLRLADAAHCFDQSDGRVLLRLSGPNARRILSKGVGTDLHPSAFDIGRSSNILCGHIGVNLARTGENEFELIVTRSLAVSLFDDLRRMGREFDLSFGFST